MRPTSPRPHFDPPDQRRCEHVALPRADQGVVNSLARAYAVETLPDDMRRMLARLG